MLWSRRLYIFVRVAPLVYFCTPFICSILIVKMYERHIFTLFNKVSPVQIYKSKSINKSRPLYLLFTYLQVQSTIFIFTINSHLEHDLDEKLMISIILKLHFKAVLVV